MEAVSLQDAPLFPSYSAPTTAAFLTNANRPPGRKCAYCSNVHSSHTCDVVTSHEARMDIAKTKKLCFNCLGPHVSSRCGSKFSCRTCGRRGHHISLCRGESEVTGHGQSGATPTPPQPSRDQPHRPTATPTSIHIINDTTTSSPTLDVHETPVTDRSTGAQDSTMLHASARPNVLLKTAIAPVWSATHGIEANIQFDEGGQRSFISETFAQKIQFHPTSYETLNLAAFGDTETRSRQLKTGTVTLETLNGKRIPLHVAIVPSIAAPILTSGRLQAANLAYLTGLTLAHPLTDDYGIPGLQ